MTLEFVFQIKGLKCVWQWTGWPGWLSSPVFSPGNLKIAILSSRLSLMQKFNFKSLLSVSWATGTTGGPMMESLDQVPSQPWSQIWGFSSILRKGSERVLLQPTGVWSTQPGRCATKVGDNPRSTSIQLRSLLTPASHRSRYLQHNESPPLLIFSCNPFVFFLFLGGQAHGVWKNHKHRTKSSF